MKHLLPVVATAILFTGCASVPMGDEAHDTQLKTFAAVPKDKAGLYIYRNERMGGAAKMDVEVDGQPIGQTARYTYLYKELAPGKHTVTSKAENTDTLEVNLKAGTLTYIWQEVKMGFLYARTKLNLVSEAEGKQGVLETTLAETK
jgi:hypothetical protein